MQWHQLDPEIMKLLKHYSPPKILIIHLGSNDLVTEGLTSKKFVEEITCSLLRYNALLPNTKLVWSAILPRLYWHGAPLGSGHKIDKKRKKINKQTKKFISELRGGVIWHHNISVHNVNLFRYDGTHLSDEGNRIFLDNFRSGLLKFINPNC